jgi:prophage regulatory protein
MPSCVGKLPLGVAVAQLTSLACDIDPDELEAEVAIGNGALAATFRWLLEHLQSGHILAWTRPLGGGLPQHLAVGYWQIDNATPRFVSSQISIAAPFDHGAPPDSWLFIDEEDFVGLWNLIVAAAEQRDEIRHSLPRMSHQRPTAAVAPFPNAAHGDERLLSLEEVMAKVSMSSSAIYARIAKGKFPKPMKVGRSSRWNQAELDQWVATLRSS